MRPEDSEHIIPTPLSHL